MSVNRTRLNDDLTAFEESNEALTGVLKPICFNRQAGKNRIPNVKLRELIKHFNKYRLRNEDFVFPDLLGAANEYLIKDYNCNIRRYADNAPPPEAHDIQAHLLGGIPKVEVEAKSSLLAAHGFEATRIFVERN